MHSAHAARIALERALFGEAVIDARAALALAPGECSLQILLARCLLAIAKGAAGADWSAGSAAQGAASEALLLLRNMVAAGACSGAQATESIAAARYLLSHEAEPLHARLPSGG